MDLILERQHRLNLEGVLGVRMLVCFKDERVQDIDNRAKVFLDSLAHGAMIGNDSQIETLEIRRGPNSTPGAIYLTIWRQFPERAENLSWIAAGQ